MDNSGISEEARGLADSGLVLGKPVVAGRITVIPVVQASVSVADLFGPDGIHYASARVKPAAVIIITDDRVEVVAIGDEPAPFLETVTTSLPEILENLPP